MPRFVRWIRILVPIVLAILSSGAEAQYQTRTRLDWFTIETARFSFHFPRELEPWARAVAGKMEAIDTSVSRVVGFQPRKKIEVVLDDPFRIPNGSAWPLIDAPAMVLWASPPNPREDIGNYVSWADMLATHEFAHLAHLLRPTRNSLQSLLWKVAPVELGPISRKSPRWMIEGYATYVEGLITKSGRPNGVWRPAILRQWAIEGALPTYGQLDAMSGMYGGDLAYLAGSAFVEWLVDRRGDTSVVDLWRRLSARNNRGFVEAFTGVYGEPPAVLYGRFTSQLTADAIATRDRVRRTNGDTGTTIQHLARETGDPAISTDGGRAAIMLASATRPGRVVVWSTLAEPDTLAARAAKALRDRDPEDVPSYRPFPPEKKALATLRAVGNQSYQDPRFFRDGRILVWRNTAIGDGSWSPDLYIWDPQRNSVSRLTRRANLRQGDPSPDGTIIAATRCAAGRCDLVFVDAATGIASVAAEGSDSVSFHRPRFSPDGRRVLVGIRSEGFWRLAMVDVAVKSLRIITTGRTNYFDGSFVDSSRIVAASDNGGTLNVVLLGDDGRSLGAISSVAGAAVAPQVNPADGSVWFLALHARGWDVRSASGALVVPPGSGSVAPDRPLPVSLATARVNDPTRYSPRRKWIYFPGVVATRDGSSGLLGIANTDPVGKTEVLIQLAKSATPGATSANWEGASATLTSRSRVPWSASMYSIAQEGPNWRALRGGTISAEISRRLETSSLRAMFAATASQATTDYGYEQEFEGRSRMIVFGETGGSLSRYRDGRRTTAQLAVSGAGGRYGVYPVARMTATAGLSSAVFPFGLVATVGRAWSSPYAEQFTIGGPPVSLLPPGILSQRITMPVLPPHFVGENLQTFRLSIPLVGVQAYSWAGRAWTRGNAPRFELVTGLEWSASIAQIAALGAPAGRITAGVGRWENRRAIGHMSYLYSNRLFIEPGRRKIQAYVMTQVGDWSR